MAARFGPPQWEIFLLPEHLKLTVTYDSVGSACTFRIETREHSDRVASSLTDSRYWTNAEHITRVIADLVPVIMRNGEVKASVADLRPGEQMRIESYANVDITRIQRSRRLLTSDENPIADRLVTIRFTRPACG